MNEIPSGKYTFINKNNQPVLMLNNDPVVWPHLYDRHCHRMLEISACKEGLGTYSIGEREYECRAGDVFIIGNTEEHQLVPSQECPIYNMTIHFDPDFVCMPFETNVDASFLTIFFNRSRNFSNRLDRDNPATARIYQSMLDLEKEAMAKKPYYHLKVKVMLENILLEIMRDYDYCNQSANPPRYSKRDLYRINDVLDYIDYNLGKKLTLDELAKIACVSPAYFSSIFKQYHGISLFEYIAQKRVEYAISLIRSTNSNMAEIAQTCGFNNSTSFNKTFQRIMGCSPSSLRKGT